MSKDLSSATTIAPAQVETYLRSRGIDDARVIELHPLGQETQAGLKAYGYGRPLLTTFETGGERRQMVIRTMSPDPFGHMRRADRAGQMILCFDTFDAIPEHIHADDMGAFGDNGELISIPRGEFFLVTNYVEGDLYAGDLHALIDVEHAPEGALIRARALATYLAELHSVAADPSEHGRDIRDTIGSGEGIFGQCDAYPADHPVATQERLQRIETMAVAWRWKLKDKAHRAKRTHGDFHPFNILFREGADFSVLDCSRGAAGDPADDVTCISINYLFFAINATGEFKGALRQLWSAFWASYLDASNDREVLETVAPYFMWRTLVVASPTWYPDLNPDTRDRLLRFGERLLDGQAFDPECIDELLT